MASPKFDQPAVYRIIVSGHLGAGWSDYLHGMTIDNHDEMDVKVATLTGRLVDQAALLGVLNALYDGHVTVLAVKRLTGDWQHIDQASAKTEMPASWQFSDHSQSA